MLDGHLAVVTDSDAGVDSAEAALAQDLAHLVGALEGLLGAGVDDVGLLLLLEELLLLLMLLGGHVLLVLVMGELLRGQVESWKIKCNGHFRTRRFQALIFSYRIREVVEVHFTLFLLSLSKHCELGEKWRAA